MAFEKAKVLKAAEKFLSQGKINAAIKEYRQIVENDEDDLTTLNMLGDLCARARQNDEAISCFLRIAEHYREREFNLKAIAMYKKIDRLKPRDPAIASQLGTLYAIQGLVADARAQYLIVADAYTRAGKTKQTLEILHKVADLDPNNTDIRLKLAEGYLKEGLKSEAAAAFNEAGSRLFDTGQFEKSLSSYSQTLNLFPHDTISIKGVVATQVALGAADEAAELLEKLVAEKPDDSQLVLMLARAYIDAEDPRGAERATSILMQQEASNYVRLIEVAQLYLKIGEVNEATRVLAGISEQLLAGREENDLLELVKEALVRDPEHVGALRLLVRIHWWQRDMESLRLALERLAEAAKAAEMVDDERYALTQLVRLAADERYSQRLIELGAVPEEAPEEFTFGGETPAEAPKFENFALVGEEFAAAPAGHSEGVAPVEFEWNSASQHPPQDPNASFADLNEDRDDSEVVFSPDVNEPSAAVFEAAGASFDETASAHVEGGSPAIDEARLESLMHQELESVDFYLAQGYLDIAADTLDLMERQFGSHAKIDSCRQRLNAAVAIAEETPSVVPSPEIFEFDAEAVVSDVDMNFAASGKVGGIAQELSAPPNVPPLSADGKGIDAGLAAIFEEFRMAAEEEPSTNEDYETHYNMGTAYKEMDLLDEAIQEFQTAAGLTMAGDGTSRYLQCCNMLGHCFMQKDLPRAAVLWFKKGLDAPGHGQEEYKALRYELASAYEQMGDLSRARDVYTEVYGVDVSYRGVAEKLKDLEAQRPGKKRRK